MGYNATLVVLHDALDQIGNDPKFGEKVKQAVLQMGGGAGRNRVDIAAGNHCNAASVIETHHADQTAVVLVGGNYGSVAGMTYGWAHHEVADQLSILKRVLGDMGYNVVKKPARGAAQD